MKKQIATGQAPKAVGPYSQAVSTDGFLFVSGQIPLDPETGRMVGKTIEEQAERVFQNIRAILNEAGLDFSDVVSATVYLADIGDFAAVNEVYAGYFSEGVLPARSAIQVGALPKQAKIEISCVAQEK
ncbi:RidA family protein [Sporolactobacillus putidus]|nr:RidA family protein [Sporolactobacillus putidus]